MAALLKPLLSIGFRPFFLFSSVASVVLVTIWQLTLSGKITLDISWNPIIWHGHEMIFGFVSAVIAGFILTASQNWTGIKGVQGNKLHALVIVWLLARLLSMSSGVLQYAYVFFDLSFYPLLSIYLVPYLAQKSQRRNWIFFVFFALMFTANLMVHLDQLGIKVGGSFTGLRLAVNAVMIVIILIAGRIIPFFTNKVIPTAQIVPNPLIEKLAVNSLIILLVADVFVARPMLTSVVAGIAAIIHIIRFSGWAPIKSRSIPILFILYVSYFWFIVYLIALALSPFLNVNSSTILHILTVGAIGMMIYSMITRVSLGHTGRSIVASKSIVFSYVLMNVAVVFRTLILGLFPEQSHLCLLISSICWGLAFLIFIIVYAKILLTPRVN